MLVLNTTFNLIVELELWKKGQLAADEDEENEDPSAILTTEDLGNGSFGAPKVTNHSLNDSIDWPVNVVDKKVRCTKRWHK